MSAETSSTQRLRRALPVVYAAAAVRLLQPLLLWPLMAQRLGAEAFGRASYVLVWGGLLAMLVEGGFLASATRLAVRAGALQRWQLAQQVASARVVLCVAVLPLTAIVLMLTGGAGTGWSEGLAIVALACALGWPANWYLQASQQQAPWARVELLVYTALILLSVLLAHDLMSFLGLQILAAATLALLGWRWLRRDLAPTVAPDARLVRREALRPGLRLGWSMLPVSIAGAAYSVALPAAASLQMTPQALGTYFLGDRLVRALLNGGEPVFSLIYPRIVARQAMGLRTSLAYAMRWALGGLLVGTLLLGSLLVGWHQLEPWILRRAGQVDLAGLKATLTVLGGLLPLLLSWKFIGYWILGSGRFDTAYRASMLIGGVAGTLGAATWNAAAQPAGLAMLALGVEGLVIAVVLVGVVLTRWRERALH